MMSLDIRGTNCVVGVRRHQTELEMLIPRNFLLYLANIELAKFQSRQRRGQVPSILRQPNPHYNEDEADARGYLPIDAVLLGISEIISERTNLSPEGASRLVERNWEAIFNLVESWEDQSQGYEWISITFENYHSSIASGDFPMLAKLVASELGADHGDELQSVCLIRVAEYMAKTVDRAKELRIRLQPTEKSN